MYRAGRYLKDRGGQVLLQVRRITQAAVHWEPACTLGTQVCTQTKVDLAGK